MKTILTKAALYNIADVSKNLTDSQIHAAALAAHSNVLARCGNYVKDLVVFIGNQFTNDFYADADDAIYTYLYADASEFSDAYDATKNIVAVGLKDKKDILNKLLLAVAFRTVAILALTAGTVITQQGTIKTRKDNYVDADGKTLAEFVSLFNSLSDETINGIIVELSNSDESLKNRRGVTFKTYGVWKS
jgi:hypothetical protein